MALSIAQVFRVELERLDRGYEARVPEIQGLLSVGLTEGETLRRLEDVLGRYVQPGADPAATRLPIRLEVFRT